MNRKLLIIILCILLSACRQETVQETQAVRKDLMIAVFGADTSGLNDQRDRADVIKIIRFDPQTDSVRVLSVQRDTMAEIPGYGFSKINRAHDLGGAQLQLETLNANLDLDIENYISFSFGSLIELVGIAGGLDLPLTETECRLLNISYEPGRTAYRLNGEEVLAFVRIRSIDDDWHRIERQDLVLRSLADRFRYLSVSEIIQILGRLDNVEYRFEPETVLSLKEMAACSRTEMISFPFSHSDHIRNLTIDGIDNIYEPVDLMSEVCEAHRWLLEEDSCTFRQSFLELKNRMYSQYPVD